MATRGWAIEPDGLAETLVRLTRDYHPPPIYVHENGAAFDSGLDEDDRITFLRDHVRAASDALAAGVDLRGYFVWSLLANFEWAEGYRSASASSGSTSTPSAISPRRASPGTGT